jgi:signal transduction histidine kinase
MTLDLAAIVYAFYAGTIVSNMVVAAMQYASERDRAKKLVLVYWGSLIVMSLGNVLVGDLGISMVIVAASGTVVAQLLLGSVLAEVLDVRIDLRPSALLFVAAAAAGWGLALLGVRFEIYGSVVAAGAVWPFPHAVLQVRRKRSGPLTTAQKMFLGTALLMSFHYLNYAWMRPRPELFLVGSGIAFGLFHILSSLLPMMVVEHALHQRNAHLEDEVRRRVRQLTSSEERLWEANRLASLGRMAGSVAHELNTPLSIIGLHADHIRADVEHDRLTQARAIAHVSGIHGVIGRIARMTEGLRRLARESAGERRQADLRALVDVVLAAHAARLDAAGIDLRPDLEPGPWPVLCDPVELAQLLAHLLDNAIEAVAPLGTKWIRVSAATHGPVLELAVEDAGRISPEASARLMEPFFTTKPVGTGTGLSLSISKAIAESHGGSLDLDRRSATTRFVLRLPRAAE